jgi:acetoin utilization deacetylase AcuC-like enzyme
MHGAANYPFKKERSDLDIPLKKNTTDQEYLSLLKDVLPRLIEEEKPDFMFYLCGVDVLATDKLGTLGLSPAGCRERDLFVLETCHNHQIPVQCSMGGGYSSDIKIIVEAHANTFRLAQQLYF